MRKEFALLFVLVNASLRVTCPKTLEQMSAQATPLAFQKTSAEQDPPRYSDGINQMTQPVINDVRGVKPNMHLKTLPIDLKLQLRAKSTSHVIDIYSHTDTTVPDIHSQTLRLKGT